MDKILPRTGTHPVRIPYLRWFPPGWVNIKPPTGDRVQLQTPQLVGITQRKKERTVMENTGLPFDKCRKLSDAIAATYDILEGKGQWYLFNERF
jgi:hypothetical protein